MKRVISLILSITLILSLGAQDVAASSLHGAGTEPACQEQLPGGEEDTLSEAEENAGETGLLTQEPGVESLPADDTAEEKAAEDELLSEEMPEAEEAPGDPELNDAPEGTEEAETEMVEVDARIGTPSEYGYRYIPGEEDVESITVFADDAEDRLQSIHTEDSLPTSFTTSRLPGLRSQGAYETCWAHSAMATAEINVMKEAISSSVSRDYSELHLAYFTYNTPTDPLGGTSGDTNGLSGATDFMQVGGNHSLSSNILASWVGAVNESYAPYSSAETALANGLNTGMAYNGNVAWLRNYYRVSTSATDEDRNAIKRMVRDLGASEIAYFALQNGEYVRFDDGTSVSFSQCYDNTNKCYYYPVDNTTKTQNGYAVAATNHSVTIVGWDDSFPASNFKTRPDGDGAWLIRNSWTTTGSVNSKDYNGYFWLSYYDKGIAHSAAWGYEYDESMPYQNNYQYDGGMSTRGYGWENRSVGANVFTAHANAAGETLRAVSICTLYNTNVSYKVQIYKDLTDAARPNSGTCVSTTQGATTYAGYYTVELDQPVALESGDTFSVVVTLEKSGDSLYLPYERTETVSGWFSTQAYAAEGQSFVSYSGSSWTDVSKINSSMGNLRIKAFTTNGIASGTQTYTVAFHSNDGNDRTRNQTVYRDSATALDQNTFSRTGYSFSAWNTKADGSGITYYDRESVTNLAAANSTIHLYAQWNPNEYTVNLDANGGSCSTDSITVTYGSTYGTLPTPTRAGYTFDGWYTAKNGGTKIVSTTTVSTANLDITASTHTLYARWTIGTYTITFNANGGSCSQTSKNVTFGSAYGTLPTPKWTGYTFAGWYTAVSGGTKIEAGTTVSTANLDVNASTHLLYAHWTGKTYTITFNGNGGTCSEQTRSVTFGATYGGSGNALPVPVRAGYTFAGWYTAASGGSKIEATTTVSTANLDTDAGTHTLYAHWTPKTYTITFDGNGGTCSEQTRSVTFGATYGGSGNVLPIPVRAGYTFDDWYTAKSGGTKVVSTTTVSTANLDVNASTHTLYAHWTAKTYTVSFDGNGGTCSEQSRSVTFGATYGGSGNVLPVPVRAGYDFGGWYTAVSGGSRIEAGTTVSTENLDITASTHTLYAHWTPKTYTITFNGNGGTCSEQSRSVTFGATYGGSGNALPVPVRAGYDFDGWYTAASGGSRIEAGTTVSTANLDVNAGTHTLYARWKGETWTVMFDGNGGTCTVSSKEIEFGAAYGELPDAEDATRAGYSFAGWFTAVNGTDQVYATTPADFTTADQAQKTITLYAHWTPETYTITFDGNGGTCSEQTRSVTFGATYGGSGNALPVPARAGYDFDGWYTAVSEGTKIEAGTTVSTANLDINAGMHTLYARWTPKTYTVSFDGNGGTCSEQTRSVTFGATYGGSGNALPVPTREGYDFAGWYTAASDGTRIEAATTVSTTNLNTNAATHTLYAHWMPKTYTLTFDGNGGTCSEPTRSVTFGEAYGGSGNALPVPERAGYDFVGWYTAASGGSRIEAATTVSTANLNTNAATHTLYAHWTGKTYTITFNGNGGTCSEPTRIVTFGEAYGGSGNALPVPEREGYDFAGWYTAASGGTRIEVATTVSAANLDTDADTHTLYAHWTGKSYTVTFNGNGGTCTEQTRSVTFGGTYGGSGNALPVPEREGYDFAGWYTAASEGSQIEATTTVTAENLDITASTHTLYAHWTVKMFTVTLYGNGGTWNGMTVMTLGTRPWRSKLDPAELTAPYYDRKHTFTGWYLKGGEEYDFDTEIRSDLSLYAGWNVLNYSGFHVEGIEASYIYTGTAIKPAVSVYDYDSELELSEKRDYMLVYQNCINVGEATLLIKGKGNYSDMLTEHYEILPRDFSADGDFADEFRADDIYVAYNAKKAQNPNPILYRNNKKLIRNKDYLLSWVNTKTGDVNADCKESGVYKVTLTGTGNYKGTRTIDYVIAKADQTLINTAKVTIPNVNWTGSLAEPESITVKLKNKTLVAGQDYEILWPGQQSKDDARDEKAMTDAGSVTVRIKGIGLYAGMARGTYRIVGQPLKPAWIQNVQGADSFRIFADKDIEPLGAPEDPEDNGWASVFSEPFHEHPSEKLVKGKDYLVSYTNNRNAGTATMTITGMGRYTGSASVKFTITPRSYGPMEYVFSKPLYPVFFCKGGSYPVLAALKVCGISMKEGRDYKVTYKNATRIGNGGQQLIVTGLGNFKGYSTSFGYHVDLQDIGEVVNDKPVITALVPNVVYTGKAGIYTPVPTLTDSRSGLKLGKTDYSTAIRYYYGDNVGSKEITQLVKRQPVPVVRHPGDSIEKADIIPAGTKLCMEITGINGFTGTKTIAYTVQEGNLAKATVKIADQAYTGHPVELTKADIQFTVTGNMKPVTEDDFEIVGYSNNIKKGTASVILKGKGNYAGLKTVKFKIGQRKLFPFTIN